MRSPAGVPHYQGQGPPFVWGPASKPHQYLWVGPGPTAHPNLADTAPPQRGSWWRATIGRPEAHRRMPGQTATGPPCDAPHPSPRRRGWASGAGKEPRSSPPDPSGGYWLANPSTRAGCPQGDLWGECHSYPMTVHKATIIEMRATRPLLRFTPGPMPVRCLATVAAVTKPSRGCDVCPSLRQGTT